MEVSRRTFIKTYVSDDDFLQYRQTNLNSLLGGLLIYSFDLFIIYNKSRQQFSDFLDKVKEFVPDLAFQFFGDFKPLFMSMTIESFDKMATEPNFIEFTKQVSNKIVKRLKTRVNSASLTEGFSKTFTIPIYYINNNEIVKFDDVQSYIDFFPIHVHPQGRDAIILKYPSVPYIEQILEERHKRTQPKGTQSEKCAICNKTFKNKMLYSCPKGCSVCYFCWDISIYSKNIKKCPNCMTVRNEAPKSNGTGKVAEYSVPYNSHTGPNMHALAPYKKNWIESDTMTKSVVHNRINSSSEAANSISSSTQERHSKFASPPFKQRSPNLQEGELSPVPSSLPLMRMTVKQKRNLNSALSYSSESSQQCLICYNYFKESSFFYCPNACSVCYQCWAQQLVDKKSSECPKCTVFLPDAMRFKLEMTTSKYVTVEPEVAPVICRTCNRETKVFSCKAECHCAECAYNKIRQKKETLCCRECTVPYSVEFLEEIYSELSKPVIKYQCGVCKERRINRLVMRSCLVCSTGLICVACIRANPDIYNHLCTCKRKLVLTQNVVGNMPQQFGFTDCCREKLDNVIVCPSEHAHIIHRQCVFGGKCPICLTLVNI